MPDRSANPDVAAQRGLRTGNVADTVRAVRPFGVDLCAGVRTSGHPDRDKLRDFMAMAGNAGQQVSATAHHVASRFATR